MKRIVETPPTLRGRTFAAMTFASFVPFPGNHDALDAVLRWAARVVDSRGARGPVVLIGPTGSGKTHLVHAAIALAGAATPGANALCTSAADFIRAFTSAIRADRAAAFQERMRQHEGVVVIEHLEDLVARPHSLLAVLDLVSAASGAGSRLLLTLTARRRTRAPSSIVETIRTRLLGAQVVRLRRLTPSVLRRANAVAAADAAGAREPDREIAALLATTFAPVTHEVGSTRMLLVLDASARTLRAALTEGNFLALSPDVALDAPENQAAYLGHRVLVTSETRRYLPDASVHDFGIIGLDALPCVSSEPTYLANPTARLVSRAVAQFSLATRRGAFVLLLHPEGRHVFRAID